MKVNLEQLDKRYVWHPFTQMRDWLVSKNAVIVAGKGSYLIDSEGRRYLDGNSSIWTNLHGHRNFSINRAIQSQLNKIAHCSSLGLGNEPASLLARKLIQAAPRSLKKVFYSDDGSTALEAAIKMVFQYGQNRKPKAAQRTQYLTLEAGYHGDTVGAMSVGGVDAFHQAYRPLLFPSRKVMAPYCYRCPFNKAKPERRDAREYRRCQWECISQVEKKINVEKGRRLAGAVLEPLVQGAAGMIAHPKGYLKRFARLCRQRDVPLILDEVMTGFGRTGSMFACEKEGVEPDLLCLAKGLTGGYLPLAATLASQKIFDAFLGDYAEKKTFFHGHSYTANPLGCAAALANLSLFENEKTLLKIQKLTKWLSQRLQALWKLEHVGDIRQEGLIVGIELVRNWKTREPYSWKEKTGVRICEEAKKLGLITRPIGNVLVLMPPYCVTFEELEKMVQILEKGIRKVCPNGKSSLL